MKSIVSGALATGLVAVCLAVHVQAKSLSPVSAKASATAISDTGKMSKMDKMSKKKKMDKMSTDKMAKKKMAKDTSGKM